MEKLFQIMLSSAVIVAILNNIVVIYNHNKNSKLQYITSERSEWRKEIKNIALELQEANLNTIESTLVKLKVRINSYGQYPDGNYPEDKELNFFKDEHLWKIISKIQNLNDDKELEHNKIILINSLSCLLKFDWERSKEEVKSSKISFISIFFLIISIVTYMCIGFEWPYVFNNKNIEKASLELLEVLFFLISPYIIVAVPYWLDIPKFFQTKNWYRSKHIISYIVGFVYLIVIVLSSYYIFKHGNVGNIKFLHIFEISYVISILCCVFFYNEKKKIYINYDNSILNILGIHKEKVKNISKVK